MRCSTCGTLLGDIQLIHEEETTKIDNSNLSVTEKNKKKEELMNKYGISRYCCRMRILGNLDLINIIK